MLDADKLMACEARDGDDYVLKHAQATATAIAQAALQYQINEPDIGEIVMCCDEVADHLEFEPGVGNMRSFLNLHPMLRARVIEWSAADTEVRTEICEAVVLFCLRTNLPREPSEAFKAVIARQWASIWS